MNAYVIEQTTSALSKSSMGQEVTLLLIGGAIAIISSIATLIVTNIMDKHGKLRIYKKIVYSKAQTGGTWGFHQATEDMSFQIPLWIEIQNTTNTTQVVRNLNAWLYRSGNEICSMTQVNRVDDTIIANNGAYSFVIAPRSIQKYDCHFTLKKQDAPGDGIFDEVKIAYFDTRDKRKIFSLLRIDYSCCWKEKQHEKDKDWTLLSK